jgi:hypothetical protein
MLYECHFFLHFHQTFLLELGITSYEVNIPFFVECQSFLDKWGLIA